MSSVLVKIRTEDLYSGNKRNADDGFILYRIQKKRTGINEDRDRY